MNGQPGVVGSVRMQPSGLGAGRGTGQGTAGARRSPAGRVAPLPAGPGRAADRPVRRRVRPVPARRVRASSRRPARVAGWARAETVQRRAGRGRSGPAILVLVGLASAAMAFGLGALADVMAAARVPDTTGRVVVRADETLWQVAHRAAPSAEPAAVVRRIVELNDLASPSVEAGRVLVSPIG
jgi:hypothetical protein